MAGENPALAQHIKKCQEPGHRNKVTFLSKTFINNTLFIIREHLVATIVDEINRNGGCFGLLMDGSQDVSSKEQISVVVRYVNDTYDVVERTISFFNATDTSGEALYERLRSTLLDAGLLLSNIVGCSFDGASNMRGEFNGLQSFIKQDNVHCMYVWCVSHQFNLAVNFASDKTPSVAHICNIAENSAKIFRGSYIRMNIWIEVAKNTPGFDSKRRLKLIGKTRWSSKPNAISAIIGAKTSLYVLIKALIKICGLKNVEKQKLEDACENLNSWVKFENIVTTYMLHTVFTLINETCVFLQKSGLSFVDGIKSLKECCQKLNIVVERIDSYLEEAHEYVKNTIELLNADEELQSHHIEFLHLPTEEDSQEIILRVQIEICSFVRTLQNRINNHILVQFDHDDSIHCEMQSLDPSYLMDSDEPICIGKLCEINNVDQNIAKQELRDLIFQFLQYQNRSQHVSVLNNNNKYENCDEDCDDDCDEHITVLIEEESDFEETTAGVHFESVKFETIKKTCYCSLCILKYIGANDERKKEFKNIFKLYKYIALIPCTQVKCERDFSKMKLTKTRLRASLSDKNLQNLMLISTESNMFEYINLDDILKLIIDKSTDISLYMHT